MKVFNKDGKVNFVDDRNVFVGYDIIQSCCENADWFIHNEMVIKPLERKDTSEGDVKELSGWNFDTSFYHSENSGEFEEGGIVIFKLEKDGISKFLHIFNAHNGYYSHGFEFKNGNYVIVEGSI